MYRMSNKLKWYQRPAEEMTVDVLPAVNDGDSFLGLDSNLTNISAGYHGAPRR